MKSILKQWKRPTIQLRLRAALGSLLALLVWLTTAVAAQASGWAGEYYNNLNFTGTKVSRTDANIDFPWGSGSPVAGIEPLTYSVRWTGRVRMTPGHYIFNVRADDGVQLYVDNMSTPLLSGSWNDHGATDFSASVDINTQTAVDHTIRLEYYQNTGVAEVHLSWDGPEGDGTIPADGKPAAITLSGIMNPDGHTVHLTWSGGAGADVFHLQRRRNAADSWTEFRTETDTAIQSYEVDSGGLTYDYRIIASNGPGNDAVSNAVTVGPPRPTPTPSPTPPPTPYRDATVSLSKSYDQAQAKYVLNWSSSQPQYVTGWRLSYRNLKSDGTPKMAWVMKPKVYAPAETSQVVSPSMTTQFKIEATFSTTGYAVRKVDSLPVTVYVSTLLPPVFTKACTKGKDWIQLYWTSVEGATYVLRRGQKLSGSSTVTYNVSLNMGAALNFRDTALASGQTYYYQIQALRSPEPPSGYSSISFSLALLPQNLSVQLIAPLAESQVASPVSLIARLVSDGQNPSAEFSYRKVTALDPRTTTAWTSVGQGHRSPGTKEFSGTAAGLAPGIYDFRVRARDSLNADAYDLIESVQVIQGGTYQHVAWVQGRLTWVAVEEGPTGLFPDHLQPRISDAIEICNLVTAGGKILHNVRMAVPYVYDQWTGAINQYEPENGFSWRKASYKALSGYTGSVTYKTGKLKLYPHVRLGVLSYKRLTESTWHDISDGGTIDNIHEGKVLQFKVAKASGQTNLNWPDGYPIWGGRASGQIGPEARILVGEITETGQQVSVECGNRYVVHITVIEATDYEKPNYSIRVERVTAGSQVLSAGATSETVVAAGAQTSSEHKALFEIKVMKDGVPEVESPVRLPRIIGGESGTPSDVAGQTNAELAASVSFLNGGLTNAQGIVRGVFRSSDVQTDVQLQVVEEATATALVHQFWVTDPTSVSTWSLPESFQYDTPVSISFNPFLKNATPAAAIKRHKMNFLLTSITELVWNEAAGDYDTVTHSADAANFAALYPAAGNNPNIGTYMTRLVVPSSRTREIDGVVVNAEDATVWVP